MGFHLSFKTADLQAHKYTTLVDNVNVANSTFCLFNPVFISDPETQVMFDEFVRKSFTVEFDSCTTDKKVVNTRLEVQKAIGLAEKVISFFL